MNNWQTTLTGTLAAVTSLLTALAALPTELGDVAQIIPPDYKAKIFTVGLVSTLALKVINSFVQADAKALSSTADSTATIPTVTK